METINTKGKMENGKWKILSLAICNLQFAIFLSGCLFLQVGGEIQKGRIALLHGAPSKAAFHFQKAARLQPNYLTNFTLLDQGVWTYVGRAAYGEGKLAQAREALEKAREAHERDHLAKLYLGAVLIRQKQRDRGLREVEAGLKGLDRWFDNITRTSFDGLFWDPDHRIRSEIRTNLAMLSGGEIDWQALVANVEWIGNEIEDEIDLAREDRYDDLTLDGDDSQN